MGKLMKRIFTAILTLVLIGCAHPVVLSDKDKEITELLVGSWFYSIKTEACPESGGISFKRNGKYSRSSENCHLADDSFGFHYYGWYVADEHICFVNSKEHLIHAKSFGFVKDHCKWKIDKYSKNEMLVHQYWYIDRDEDPTIVSFERDENP